MGWKKLAARNKQTADFQQRLATQIEKLIQEQAVHRDFVMEMGRFIPEPIKQLTLDNPEYWAYVQSEVNTVASELLNDGKPATRFDMG